jgi:hypothetical protein
MMGARIQELAVLMLTIVGVSVVIRNARGFSTAVNAVGGVWNTSLRTLLTSGGA